MLALIGLVWIFSSKLGRKVNSNFSLAPVTVLTDIKREKENVSRLPAVMRQFYELYDRTATVQLVAFICKSANIF